MGPRQRGRDPQLQVVTNKSIDLKGHTLQQLDSIISAKGQTAYSSVVLGKVDNKLLTLQITLPAEDQQKAQDMLIKMLGGYKETVNHISSDGSMSPQGSDVTEALRRKYGSRD